MNWVIHRVGSVSVAEFVEGPFMGLDALGTQGLPTDSEPAAAAFPSFADRAVGDLPDFTAGTETNVQPTFRVWQRLQSTLPGSFTQAIRRLRQASHLDT